MTCFGDSLGNRILDCLNIEIPERCNELTILFERCNLRELQNVFPTLVESVFGYLDGRQNGWGLRTTVRENATALCYDHLFQFFAPMGPMLKLCYRLIHEPFKFEVNLNILPQRAIEMLQSGENGIFYSDLLNIDPYTRSIRSLSLNAFDYYMLHFVLHGIVPLHTKYSLAQQVHVECTKTAYLMLVTDYLATFLPARTDTIIPPADLCLTVKAPQPLPMPTLQPQRSPKYLKIPTNNLFAENRTQISPTVNISNQTFRHAGFSGELARNNTWRTETVLHFFIDLWLRADIENARHLPSSEFIRVVRLLVKQVHSFALAAPLDDTTMLSLRQIAQPMLRTRIYGFLRSAITRWPLDSSMAMVLELWYSYIQPWRYARYNELAERQIPLELPNDGRFDSFVAENLYIYTQIFLLVLPRFHRLDFTLLQNCIMLHRLVKVLCHSIPPRVLQEAEQRCMTSSFALDAEREQNNDMSNRQNGMDTGYGWELYFPNDLYIPMFDMSTQTEVEQFIRTASNARNHVLREMERLTNKKQITERSYGILKYIKRFMQPDIADIEKKLLAIEKIPEILDVSVRSLCVTFNLELPDENTSVPTLYDSFDNEFSGDEDNEDLTLNITHLSPIRMKNHLEQILATPAVDPAVLPVQMHECKLLVRFLHKVSCIINEMFCNEIQTCWQRQDLWGKLARQVVLPPMIAAHFEKSRGYSELCEERLPPRICLRSLGSYQTLFILAIALTIGQLLWSAPSFGLLMLMLLTVFYNFIMALMSA